MAFQLYAAENRSLYPAPRQVDTADKVTDPSNPAGPKIVPSWGNPSANNWPVEISRYIYRDQAQIWDVKDVYGQTNIAHCPSYDLLFNTNIKLSSQSTYSTAGYGMNYNLNVDGVSIGSGTLSRKTRFKSSAIVNPAKSVLVGDSSEFYLQGQPPSWAVSTGDTGKPDGYATSAPNRHEGSANYLFADGHVVSLSSSAALDVVKFIP